MEIEEAKRLREVAYWSEVEGRRVVALLAASGLSVAAFSKRTGVTPNRLQYWRTRCRKGGVSQPAAPVGFREVVVTPRAITGRPVTGESSWLAELASAGAWRVRVPRDFDAASLERLLAVLETR